MCFLPSGGKLGVSLDDFLLAVVIFCLALCCLAVIVETSIELDLALRNADGVYISRLHDYVGFNGAGGHPHR